MKIKNFIKKNLYHFIKCNGISVIISVSILLIAFIKRDAIGGDTSNFMDWTIFTSVIIVVLLENFSKLLGKLIINKLEDSAKLTTDYKNLVSKYKQEMIVYDNSCASEGNLKRLKKDSRAKVVFPVVCEYKLDGCKFDIQDTTQMYELPDLLAEHFGEILVAHETSRVFNQLNIRVDDWKIEDGTFVIKTSRTTYFDSLVTNRAMDYKWEDRLTVREKFEYGPFLKPLRESCLSNHLGFNGFVESGDGYIIFIKRHNHLSIGKKTYGDSIGACLKTKYALDENKRFTEKGLADGILKEIGDELKIPKEHMEEFSLEKNIIAAYRDIVEGGKPQLLFYIRSDWKKEKIEQNFIAERKKARKKDKKNMLEDGRKTLWIKTEELNQICVLPEEIIYRGKRYPMMPSASASLVMLIEYLKERK